MRDNQIIARLQVIHPNLGRLFELARTAQRKPSRCEALLTVETLAAFGENGIVLRKSSFSDWPQVVNYAPRALCDLAVTVFGEDHVAVDAAENPDENEFTFKFALVNRDPVKDANTVHGMTVFLTGLAKVDSHALKTYWKQANPEKAEKERQRARLMLANALGLIGGLNNAIGPRGLFH